jgi:hypothetical protein
MEGNMVATVFALVALAVAVLEIGRLRRQLYTARKVAIRYGRHIVGLIIIMQETLPGDTAHAICKAAEASLARFEAAQPGDGGQPSAHRR